MDTLSASSSHDESGGRGEGGNRGTNEIGASHSCRPPTDYFSNCGRSATIEDDRRSRRSLDEQPREPTQIYRHLRKESIQPHSYPIEDMYGYGGFQEMPSSFTGLSLFASSGGYDTYDGVLNDYGYSSTYTNCPTPSYPSNKPQFVEPYSSGRHPNNPRIIN
ncbi:LOW QUALITY PROTEIN: hypothetical protein Cgig2_025590 [Carnegiea gigantea]|uniref:Uncharacterized protein n=1 Tax=Carnegiea gigantea TaxID=171969 RepID=A0A9Q1Q517_9CARY|nr:LOW QUALITY PROTEIN: hypothetical protein Cgig2_025590 [Carnegiea gigantea]